MSLAVLITFANTFGNSGRSQYFNNLLILHNNKACFMKISLGLSHQATGAKKKTLTVKLRSFLTFCIKLCFRKLPRYVRHQLNTSYRQQDYTHHPDGKNRQHIGHQPQNTKVSPQSLSQR